MNNEQYSQAAKSLRFYCQIAGHPWALLQDYLDECDREGDMPSIHGFHVYRISEDDSYYADCAWQYDCRAKSSPVTMPALDGSSFAAQMNALTRCS